jgi:hypothetical protein
MKGGKGVNVNALKARMVMVGIKVPDLLDRLQDRGITMSKSAFYRKLKGSSDFNRKEILAIVEELGIGDQEMLQIFFNEKVS